MVGLTTANAVVNSAHVPFSEDHESWNLWEMILYSLQDRLNFTRHVDWTELPPIRLTQYFIIDAVTTTTKNLGLIEHQLGCLRSVAHPHCKYPWPAAFCHPLSSNKPTTLQNSTKERLTTGWPCSEKLFALNWHIQQVGNYYSNHT